MAAELPQTTETDWRLLVREADGWREPEEEQEYEFSDGTRFVHKPDELRGVYAP